MVCRPVTPSLWRKRGDRKFEAGLDYAISSSPAWDTKLDTIKQGGEQKKEMVTVLTQPRKWRHLQALWATVSPLGCPDRRRVEWGRQVPTPAVMFLLLLWSSVIADEAGSSWVRVGGQCYPLTEPRSIKNHSIVSGQEMRAFCLLFLLLFFCVAHTVSSCLSP